MSRQQLIDQLIRDEGLRLKPYTDTVGKTTIGIGRNLTDRGITKSEAMYLLDHDIADAIIDLLVRYPWFEHLDDARKAVLINMCFNLGIQRLGKFKHVLGATQVGLYEDAAVFMLQSHPWVEQIGDRALRLAEQMRLGTWV